MNLRIKKLSANVPDMGYAKAGDAGFDLYTREKITLLPGVQTVISTGYSMEIPEGYVGFIWDKGGLSTKFGLKTLGGVVDAGYRGEVMVGMINLSDKKYTFEAGHKVAQMVIQTFETVTFEHTENLSESERADTGFGSSGK